MGHHREGNVTMPTVPVSYFILIQPGLSFAFLKPLLNGVVGGDCLGKSGKSNLLGSKAKIEENSFGSLTERLARSQTSGREAFCDSQPHGLCPNRKPSAPFLLPPH